MKLVVLSESPEDEAAIRILVDGILGIRTDHIATPSLRTRGWSPLLGILSPILKQLYYRTDADALVVIVDSDDSTPHLIAHSPPDGATQGCRRCKLQTVADQVRIGLTAVPSRPPVKTAFGLAVPAIEAWLRCGLDPHALEASLIIRKDAGSRELKKQLKRAVYGTDRPASAVRMARATEEARRLVQILDEFERCFPNGFGSFARDIRGW